MVGYVFKLCGQLAIDGFDDLAEQDEEAANRLRELALLVTPGGSGYILTDRHCKL